MFQGHKSCSRVKISTDCRKKGVSDTLQGVFPGPHPAKGVKKVPNGGPQGVIWGGQNWSLETPKPWDLLGVFGPRKVTPRGGSPGPHPGGGQKRGSSTLRGVGSGVRRGLGVIMEVWHLLRGSFWVDRTIYLQLLAKI